jgi:hypothetical protein
MKKRVTVAISRDEEIVGVLEEDIERRRCALPCGKYGSRLEVVEELSGKGSVLLLDIPDISDIHSMATVAIKHETHKDAVEAAYRRFSTTTSRGDWYEYAPAGRIEERDADDPEIVDFVEYLEQCAKETK